MNHNNHHEHKEESHMGHAVAGVVGIAALAAAAAGTYFLYGSEEAPANRKKVTSWMLHLKAEIMDEVEKTKDLSEETYDEAVTKISEKYAAMKDIDKEDLAHLIKRLKSHWKDIKKDLEKITS